eukprot:gene6394-biopygen64688
MGHRHSWITGNRPRLATPSLALRGNSVLCVLFHGIPPARSLQRAASATLPHPAPPPSQPAPSSAMGGKAKPTKHTAKELAQKAHDANCNKGGGGAGKADRAGGILGYIELSGLSARSALRARQGRRGP